jgi:hypothetical protein
MVVADLLVKAYVDLFLHPHIRITSLFYFPAVSALVQVSLHLWCFSAVRPFTSASYILHTEYNTLPTIRTYMAYCISYRLRRRCCLRRLRPLFQSCQNTWYPNYPAQRCKAEHMIAAILRRKHLENNPHKQQKRSSAGVVREK